MNKQNKKSGRKKQYKPKENLIGRRFGRLVVDDIYYKNKKGKWFWWCICDCGKRYPVSHSNLIHKLVRSCGCSRKGYMVDNWKAFPGNKATIYKKQLDFHEATSPLQNMEDDSFDET
jgi:hypothetical protein